MAKTGFCTSSYCFFLAFLTFFRGEGSGLSELLAIYLSIIYISEISAR